jgi:hypothetical protein
MTKTKAFILILILGWNIDVQALDRALVIGGGCHRTLRDEMAKETININKSLTSRGWNLQNLYGDQTNSSDLKGLADATFSKKNLLEYLEKNSRELKKRDKFLLNIITHGGPRKDNNHAICLGDGTSLNLNDPEIHAHLRKMRKNGVEMGFIDNSCYGGESVKLFDDYGCTITSTIPQFPAYATYATNENFRFGISSILNEQIQSGRNASLSMEDIYIESLIDFGKKDENEILNFPLMSGDVVGEKMSSTGAFYLFLKSGMEEKLDEVILLKFVYAASLTDEEKDEWSKKIDEDITCKKNNLDQNLSDLIHDMDKLNNLNYFNFRHKKYKELFLKAENKDLIDELKEMHKFITGLEGAIKASEEKIRRLKTKQMEVASKVNRILEDEPFDINLKNELLDGEIEVLTKNGCKVGSNKKSVSCKFKFDFSDYALAILNKSTNLLDDLQIDVQSLLTKDIELQDLDKVISNRFWGKLEKADFFQDFRNSALLYDQTHETRNEVKELVSEKNLALIKFKGTFNQMRVLDYIKRSKFMVNNKIRKCRNFTF